MAVIQPLDRDGLERKARDLRVAVLDAILEAGKGHIGGAFSIIEILVTLYHGAGLKIDPENPKWCDRDRFILSKGHAGIALYATLADLGFFSREELSLLNQGGLLGEHPDPQIPGVEVVSGALGHGLSLAAGMALSNKIDKKSSHVCVLMGDGECHEGSVWEGAMFAAHHKLSNLYCIVDRNGLITHGSTESFNRLEPFAEKWSAFGWNVVEADAHDIAELLNIWGMFRTQTAENPTVVIAKSVKGKGVTFMENKAEWHHGGVNKSDHARAIEELVP